MQIKQRLARASLPIAIAMSIFAVAGTAIAATTVFDFTSMTIGTNYLWSDTLVTASATLEMKQFQRADLSWTDKGVATVLATNYAQGAAVNELNVDDIMVQVLPDTPAYEASFMYADLGGQVNLGVNGDLANVPDLYDLDGTVLGNCDITVTETSFGGGVRGEVTITPQTGYDIEKFGIGGHDLRIDDVTFSY